MLVLMGGRAADSPPQVVARNVSGDTLELVNEDIDPPAVDELGIVPGTVLADKYLVEREIGRGGIGVIVAARHLQLDQHVAIKYLQKKVLDNRTIVDRFAREARLAAQIKSDHVVRVHDVSSHPDVGPYMVMELLEGNDLGHFVEKGPLPIAQAVDYVLQACDALAEAHAFGIVHRDLKPDNLFLAKRPAGKSIVKILDFGISKAAPAQRGSGGWSHVTTASEAFGTPVYMSPEQLRSTASVDARSDIWALGVVLFELLTAKLPFNGDSIPQLCSSILEEAPRALRSLRPQSPPELEAVLLRCLEKDPARRFRNVAELAQELGRFGPQGATGRVRHITRVVEEGGSSVRPPAPMPGTYSIGGERAPVEAAKVTAVEWPPPAPEAAERDDLPAVSPRRRTTVVLAVAVVIALVAGVGLLSLTKSSAPAAMPTASPTATAAPTASTTATATTSVSAESATTDSTASAPPQTTPPSPPGASPAARAAPSGAPIATPLAPAAKPSKKSDYSQFGGRQ
jgi:serine/threonine protein kinase